MSTTIEIRSRWDATRVLYATEIDDSVPSGLRMRAALERATQARADLAGAYLADADLADADLARANLAGAYLAGDKKLKLIGPRPVLTIGPIGSRADTLVAFLTDAGIRIRAGRFFDTLDLFKVAVDETHGSNEHGREYAAAIVMIEAHAALWSPAAEPAAEAA